MANTDRINSTHVLWGAPLSLYTGKLRSYLIKKGVPYVECHPSHPVFQTRVLPAIGFLVIPVLEAPDGTIVQDTTEIIAHLEAQFPANALTPATPVQRVVAMLVDAYGSEGLLRPAMHYRWSQPHLAQNECFLRAEFGRGLCASRERSVRDAVAAPYMQAMQAYLPALGVTAATAPAVEEAHEALLDALDAHFHEHPYVLGGRPSVGDFGLMAPLYAHLARDPSPSLVMKTRAPNVYRWTERMNLANITDGEFPDVAPAYPDNDAIPATLEPVLALLFADWGPELGANAAHYNDWVARHPTLPAGALVSTGVERQLHPTLGPIRFTLRGREVTCASFPHALWHFQQAAEAAHALTGAANEKFGALVERTGGTDVMAIRLARGLARDNFAIVTA